MAHITFIIVLFIVRTTLTKCAQYIYHDLHWFSYLYILALHHHFMDLSLLLEAERLNRNSTCIPSTTNLDMKLCEYASMTAHICRATLYWDGIIKLWGKKKKSPQRQIALKFSPAAKLLQKNRTFSGKKKYIKSGLNLYW